MKRIRMIGLCLVAVFAFSAVAAASALAAPEFVKCVKASPKNTGEFTEKNCTTKASPAKTGKYEAASAVGTTFTGKIKASTFDMRNGSNAIEYTVACKKGKDTGTIEASNYAFITFEFEDKCTATHGAVKEACPTITTGLIVGLLVPSAMQLEEGGPWPGYVCGSLGEFRMGFGGYEVDSEAVVAGGKAFTFTVNGAGEQTPVAPEEMRTRTEEGRELTGLSFTATQKFAKGVVIAG